MILPIIVGNKSCKPIYKLLAHDYWLSQSRLVFGVFLCSSVFIQYIVYNQENGMYLSKMDAYLLYFAITVLSFAFSFFTYIVVEGPFASIMDVCLGKIEIRVQKR